MVVLGNIVGAGIDDHHFRIQAEHVFPKAQQHLIGRLTGDATGDEAVIGEELRSHAAPVLRDAIANEHDAPPVVGRSLYFAVVLFVSAEVRPVVLRIADKGKESHEGHRDEFLHFGMILVL